MTKNDIRVWLLKCKDKALRSVVDKHVLELAEIVKGNEKLQEIYKDGEAAVKAAETLREVYMRNGLTQATVSIQHWGYPWGALHNPAEGSLQFVGAIVKLRKEKYPKEYAVIDAASKQYSDVSNEYHTLMNKCYTMKPNKAIEYLETLGFDTSTLGPEDKPLDKSKLFVCGDNKP